MLPTRNDWEVVKMFLQFVLITGLGVLLIANILMFLAGIAESSGPCESLARKGKWGYLFPAPQWGCRFEKWMEK